MSFKDLLGIVMCFSVYVSFSLVYEDGQFHSLLKRVIPLLIANGVGLSVLLYLFLPRGMNKIGKFFIAFLPFLFCSGFAFFILMGCGMSSDGCVNDN